MVMERRLCWRLGDFDIVFNRFLAFIATFISEMPVVVFLDHRDISYYIFILEAFKQRTL